MLVGVLNDEFVDGLLGLVPAHLPQSCSLQRVRACSTVSVLSVGTIFEQLIFNNSSVATRLRCGGL